MERTHLQHNAWIARMAALIVLISALLAMAVSPAAATVFGNLRGVVHDSQHHPINGAKATLQASDSGYSMTAETGVDGEFHFDAVPLGQYSVTVEAPGFAPQKQALLVVSGSAPILHYQLAIAAAQEKVTVTAAPENLDPESPQIGRA